MSAVWDAQSGAKVYFSHSIDARQALATGRYNAAAPEGGEEAYVAAHAADDPRQVQSATERARLGGPVSEADRDMLGALWVEADNGPLAP